MSGGYHPWSKFNAHRWSNLNARRHQSSASSYQASVRTEISGGSDCFFLRFAPVPKREAWRLPPAPSGCTVRRERPAQCRVRIDVLIGRAANRYVWCRPAGDARLDEPLRRFSAHALAQGGCRSSRDAAESLRPLLIAQWSVAVRNGRVWAIAWITCPARLG